MIYQWADGSRIPKWLSAQAVAERLTYLQEKYGRVTPVDIVEDARSEASPLHKAFEWNDTAAAKAFREHQARQMIKSVRVIYDEDAAQEPRRAFVNVIREGEGQMYLTSARVMGDEGLRQQVLEKAKADLKAWRHRYHDLTELSNIFDIVDAVDDIVLGSTGSSPMAAKS